MIQWAQRNGVLHFQERVREETFDEAAKQEADFFSYIATSYRHYLNGDDEQCERVDAQQTRAFQDKADAAQAQVQQLNQVGRHPCYRMCDPGDIALLEAAFSLREYITLLLEAAKVLCDPCGALSDTFPFANRVSDVLTKWSLVLWLGSVLRRRLRSCRMQWQACAQSPPRWRPRALSWPPARATAPSFCACWSSCRWARCLLWCTSSDFHGTTCSSAYRHCMMPVTW